MFRFLQFLRPSPGSKDREVVVDDEAQFVQAGGAALPLAVMGVAEPEP